MRCLKVNSKRYGQKMNSDRDFASPVIISDSGHFIIAQLAETVLKLLRRASKTICQPLPSDDLNQRQPNIGPLKAKLSGEFRVKLEDGLEETIAYFKKIISL